MERKQKLWFSCQYENEPVDSEQSLASYKIPTMVLIHRDELPKTSTRKVKRNELEKWYNDQTN